MMINQIRKFFDSIKGHSRDRWDMNPIPENYEFIERAKHIRGRQEYIRNRLKLLGVELDVKKHSINNDNWLGHRGKK